MTVLLDYMLEVNFKASLAFGSGTYVVMAGVQRRCRDRE